MTESENSDVVYCFGFCQACDQLHFLPSARALPHCRLLMKQLREEGRMDLDTPLSEANPLFSTDSLYTDLRGKMFGILVCEDDCGNEVVLRAFSSKHNGMWTISGWAPPLVDPDRFDKTIEAGNTGIHPLTDKVLSLEKGSAEWYRTLSERRVVSQKVLAELYALYEVCNFKNEKRSLSGAFNIKKGIPTGTGDCCAPKLLNHAAKNNLTPVSLAEFFWGRETASGHRVEGEYYSSCEDKCQPLLGYMLCGLNRS